MRIYNQIIPSNVNVFYQKQKKTNLEQSQSLPSLQTLPVFKANPVTIAKTIEKVDFRNSTEAFKTLIQGVKNFTSKDILKFLDEE